jgi:hypothetical protein
MASRRFHLFAIGNTLLKIRRLADGTPSNIEHGFAGRMS